MMMMKPSASNASTVTAQNPPSSSTRTYFDGPPHHQHGQGDGDDDDDDAVDAVTTNNQHRRAAVRPQQSGRFSMYLAHLANRRNSGNDDTDDIAGADSAAKPTRANNKNHHKARTTRSSTNDSRNTKNNDDHRRRRRGTQFFFPNLGMYAVLAVLMIFCALYIVVQTFTPLGALSKDCPCRDGLVYCVCARPTIEALTRAQLACLAVSRVAAYFLYPLYLVLFLTMARNLRAYLQFTILSEYIPLTSLHHLHVRAGQWVGIGAILHSLFHLIRWSLQGRVRILLHGTATGRTGLVALVLTPLIVAPMRFARLRAAVSFEVRKRLHYLSWCWALALCGHAPQQHVAYIIGTAFAIYVVDWCYGMLAATHSLPSARFVRLESSVMIRFRKPPGFTMKGSSGYCYLCIPWVSKVEWHAFSAFVDPIDSTHYCFCIAVAGDWTRKLHDQVAEPIYRRLWICGPFPSPFEQAGDNDHVISIASGIGITPALSAIHALADHRKMHLVWICRDASLVEFVMDYGGRFDEDAYSLIFYTGERELVFRCREVPPNVFLLKGRPDLEKLIPSIIRASKHDVLPDLFDFSGLGPDNNNMTSHRPASVTASNRAASLVSEEASIVTVDDEHEFYAETARLLQSYSPDELFNAAVRRSHVRGGPHRGSRVVSMQGWRDLMDSIFTRQFTDEQVEYLFRQINMDYQRDYIDAKQFQQSLKVMEREVKRHRRTSVVASSPPLPPPPRPTRAAAKVENEPLDNPDHWRLMYCGGSTQVVDTLVKVSKHHHIPLSVESFEW